MAYFRSICLGLAVFFGLSVADFAASAQTINERAVALVVGNDDVAKRKEAFALFKMAATDGDVKAQANMGLSLLLGYGVPADPKEGGRLLRSASAAGDEFATLAIAVTLAGGNGSLFVHNSAQACLMLERLFKGPAAAEALFRFSELCSSDARFSSNPRPLAEACLEAFKMRHRVAIYACHNPNSLAIYKSAIDKSLSVKPWHVDNDVSKNYIPIFFSDRDEFLVYTILLLEHSATHWKFDVRKYLADRGLSLINW